MTDVQALKTPQQMTNSTKVSHRDSPVVCSREIATSNARNFHSPPVPAVDLSSENFVERFAYPAPPVSRTPHRRSLNPTPQERLLVKSVRIATCQSRDGTMLERDYG